MNYLLLFLVFFKVGILGFGGGYAILPLIYQDIQSFGLMSADEFSNLVALSQVTPGPIAINAATYVGYKVAGLSGAFVATFGVSLPSLVLCLLVMKILDKFKTNRVVQSVLSGIRPATVGLMMSAFVFLAQTAMWPEWDEGRKMTENIIEIDLVATIIFVVTYILILTKKMSAITLTILGGILGIVLSVIAEGYKYWV
ncbi:MAG: chromate transporter [Bacteroidales bacterium]|nr:chromate transporter [Bacteroidales bacterium]